MKKHKTQSHLSKAASRIQIDEIGNQLFMEWKEKVHHFARGKDKTRDDLLQ